MATSLLVQPLAVGERLSWDGAVEAGGDVMQLGAEAFDSFALLAMHRPHVRRGDGSAIPIAGRGPCDRALAKRIAQSEQESDGYGGKLILGPSRLAH